MFYKIEKLFVIVALLAGAILLISALDGAGEMQPASSISETDPSGGQQVISTRSEIQNLLIPSDFQQPAGFSPRELNLHALPSGTVQG